MPKAANHNFSFLLVMLLTHGMDSPKKLGEVSYCPEDSESPYPHHPPTELRPPNPKP